jgi:hypothetical protein
MITTIKGNLFDGIASEKWRALDETRRSPWKSNTGGLCKILTMNLYAMAQYSANERRVLVASVLSVPSCRVFRKKSSYWRARLRAVACGS